MADEVTLIVQNEKFYCEKSTLQNVSSYFNAMFNSSMLESRTNEVELHDIDPETFKILLSYAEHKILEINSKNSLQILKAAALLQFDKVLKDCSNYVLRNLNSETCFSTWQLTELLSLTSLNSEVKIWTLWEFEKVIKSPQFIDLPLKLLFQLLSSNGLKCNNEMNVVHCLLSWRSSNSVSKSDDIKLWSCIRWRRLETEDFEFLFKQQAFPKNLEIYEYVKNIYRLLFMEHCDLNESINEDENLKAALTSQPRVIPTVPLIIGISLSALNLAKDEDQELTVNKRNERHMIGRTMQLFAYSIETHHFENYSDIPIVSGTGIPLQGYGMCIIGKHITLIISLVQRNSVKTNLQWTSIFGSLYPMFFVTKCINTIGL